MMTLSALLFPLAAVLIASAIRHVPAGHVYSLYRRGKLVRVLQQGTHLVLPLLDRVAHKIDLAGQTLRLDARQDDAGDMRGTVYWQVLEPERADAVFEQVDQLIRRGAREALRNEPAADGADRRDVGARVKHSLNSALRERGMMVTRVELDAA
ncbi:SPFH domain-containing protein [Rhodanobacter sp. AS-Z3]|uniref:SPFH domain-containing protein n=1 Tax=Rhodanobacter sp. AS-Z3 TaxID=3031330 RepID=UPI00247A7720|nr:SPFH domain-containing protein [Rhodanobacter sp. AS-Z3]WEN15479.1 SPFH domain-containing protein [Rhodanobacter sp. AS-Z3]